MSATDAFRSQRECSKGDALSCSSCPIPKLFEMPVCISNQSFGLDAMRTVGSPLPLPAFEAAGWAVGGRGVGLRGRPRDATQ